MHQPVDELDKIENLEKWEDAQNILHLYIKQKSQFIMTPVEGASRHKSTWTKTDLVDQPTKSRDRLRRSAE